MSDSRAEFEAWFKKNGNKSHGSGEDGVMNSFFSIWQAGRESMRDEAVKICEEMTPTDINGYCPVAVEVYRIKP